MFEAKLKQLMEQINQATQNKSAENSLPGNALYLENGDVLCLPRREGVSRFPYQSGGFTMWAYSDGVIHAIEGVHNVFRPIHVDGDSQVNFFVGLPYGDGTYFPISILGGTKQLFEPFNVKRYLVYSFSAAYYIADTDIATFCIRAAVTGSRQMSFSFGAINKTDKPLNYTLNTYFEAILKNGEHDSMWVKGNRHSTYLDDGKFLLDRNGDGEYHLLLVERKNVKAVMGEAYHTVSRSEYLMVQPSNIANAESLKLGKFNTQSTKTRHATPVAAEILHLRTEETTRIDWLFTLTHDQDRDLVAESPDVFGEKADKIIAEREAFDKKRFATAEMKFGKWNSGVLNSKVMNNFVKNLQKQVDFCSMGENYVEHLLGVRDVFQQLEQAIIWSPELAREKMVRALNFIDITGRPPRQFSIPQHDEVPQMDLRPFIDQGNWILTTFYMYLAYTDDFSVLDEECGYYEFIDNDRHLLKNSDMRDSVLDHILRITDYLVSKIDTEDGTNCLRIMHGDWNDSLEGIGVTYDEGKRYGTGVSVMASLQLYRNLKEIAEVLEKIGGFENKIEEYLGVRERLAEGLKKYAVEKNEKGEVRLIHGWGDHLSYKIGSFNDLDGVSRLSFAPFAYWAISDLIKETPELKEVIIDNILALDSEYGIITNLPGFTKGMREIGKLSYRDIGFSENECAYVHASMFSVAALFLTGKAEEAWRQIEKSIIINHQNCDKTPFVMPNSYCKNLDLCIDGSSQNDWFTGAGTVLYKNLFRFGFGIEASLDGLTIQTASVMPSDTASINFVIKGKKVTLNYKKCGNGKREILLDGIKMPTVFDKIIETEKLFIPTADIKDGMVISVID